MSEYSRREILQASLGASLAAQTTEWLDIPSHAPNSAASAVEPLLLDAAIAPPAPRENVLDLKSVSRPDGQTLRVDSRSLLRNGNPWLPVMGEFHYARCPEKEWREELLKMKAGGIDIVASYVFWIHHEEEEGIWDWSGQRSLREFVRLCGELGLLFVVRAGPWSHGEARNGGFPDWLLKKGFRLRSDDPGYLGCVQAFYEQIARQVTGLLWKDGGPVIGVQCENEYGGTGQHLVTLKRLAVAAGLEVPLYTRTGWPQLTTPIPAGELLPLFGSYAEGFWDRELTPMPGKYGEAFRFILSRRAATDAIGTDLLGKRTTGEGDSVGDYPYFCCEIGGGMAVSYHRRIDMAPEDVAASSLVKIGSGNNLQGYYMYHGGTNPEGKRSSLQESQRTGYWNDLPQKTYDFQAPLGEFGQINPHYHALRRMHLFLHDWGAHLATLPARLPSVTPKNAHDTKTLRWSARTDGRSGFVFVSNYQRLQSMPAKEGVQFLLRLTQGELLFPAEPMTVPADSYFFLPFHLALRGAMLVYATAQPVCRLEEGSHTTLVFAQIAGLPAEFVFDSNGMTLLNAKGKVTKTNKILRVEQIPAGTDSAFRFRTKRGTTDVLLLSEAQSLTCWKGIFQGRERLFLTAAGLTLDADSLILTASEPAQHSVAVYPDPKGLLSAGKAVRTTQEGLFRRYHALPFNSAAVKVIAEAIRPAGAARKIARGSQGVAEAPAESDFADAAAWHITLPKDTAAERDLILRIHYTGDVARLFLGSTLLTDNFYNGKPFEIGLRRFAPEVYRQPLRLEILPLPKEAPIYLTHPIPPQAFGAKGAVHLESVEIIERHTARFITL